MNQYAEWLVKRKSTPSGVLARVVSVFAEIILVFSTLIFGPYALVAAFFGGYGVYLVFQYTELEFEYFFLDGELKVDKIYGKNKRKNCGTYPMEKVELVAPLQSHQMDSYRQRNLPTLDYSSGIDANKRYAMIINLGMGMNFIVLEPNQEILDAMRVVAPRKVSIE